MSTERFSAFFQTFERVLKNIRRISTPVMQNYGLRSVHTTCLLALGNAPGGLTVTELSRECMIDKALASRMLKELLENGFISAADRTATKNYNKRYVLTPKSQTILTELNCLIIDYVNKAGVNIPEADREVFYRVLSEFDRNIEDIGKHIKHS